jgi:hypothetical protein
VRKSWRIAEIRSIYTHWRRDTKTGAIDGLAYTILGGAMNAQ